jgi:hypothetical protein
MVDYGNSQNQILSLKNNKKHYNPKWKSSSTPTKNAMQDHRAQDFVPATALQYPRQPKNGDWEGRTMSHPQLSDVIDLPGVADLPAQARWLFARALTAEMQGNTNQAQELLELAVEWEEALSAPESVA